MIFVQRVELLLQELNDNNSSSLSLVLIDNVYDDFYLKLLTKTLLPRAHISGMFFMSSFLGIPAIFTSKEEWLFGFHRSACAVCCAGLRSYRRLRSIAHSISTGGTARSFVSPCETTAATFP